jgi:hypothetical protein
MKLINRSAVVVRPAAPFIEWLHKVDPADTFRLEEMVDDATIYLLPDFNNDDEALEYLAKVSSTIFEQELESWYRDPEIWPAQRDVIELRRWFHISFHSMLFDLSQGRLKHEQM